MCEADEIDRVNILQASLGAMRQAAEKLPPGQLQFLLVDGPKLPKVRWGAVGLQGVGPGLGTSGACQSMGACRALGG